MSLDALPFNAFDLLLVVILGAGIYTGHHYTPIPWRANLSTAAW